MENQIKRVFGTRIDSYITGPVYHDFNLNSSALLCIFANKKVYIFESTSKEMDSSNQLIIYGRVGSFTRYVMCKDGLGWAGLTATAMLVGRKLKALLEEWYNTA